ncbi:hypothetical protein DFS34DRAFT_686229 [Phlyctochytrium arcticum]|nr:hypothetical protein DFS34DRAFT_686229 [Phlyctochytrium arcticum]
MPRRLDGLFDLRDRGIQRYQYLDGSTDRNKRRANPKYDEHFTTISGDPASVICKTCSVKIQDKTSAKDKHLKRRGHKARYNAEPEVPHRITPNLRATNATPNYEDPSFNSNAMDVDFDSLPAEDLNTPNPPPTSTSSLYDYLRQQETKARLAAEAAFLEQERTGEEYFPDVQIDPPTGNKPRRAYRSQKEIDWSPFPDEATALSAVLMTNERHPYSNEALDLIWWWGRGLARLGAAPPSIKSVQGCLTKLHDLTGGHIEEHTSPLKTPFHLIDVASIIAQDVGNPERDQQCSVGNIPRREVELGSHTASTNGSHTVNSMDVFLKDFVRTVDDVSLQVQRFTMKDGEHFACGTEVKDTPQGLYMCADIKVNIKKFREIVRMPSPLQTTIVGRRSPTNVYTACTARDVEEILTPHPLKARAGGHRVIMVPIILFSDDSAGTSSKKWNAFYNWYRQLGGLPFMLSQRDFHTHFVGTSNKASALEIADASISSINSKLDTGIWTYDSAALEPVLVTGSVVCILGDNPMHSELCSTMEFGKANRFCRACKVSGKIETAEELQQFLAPGEPRNWASTQAEIRDQLDMACIFGNKTRLRKQQTTTDTLTEYAKSHSVEAARAFRDAIRPVDRLINPLFRLNSFNGHNDTPLEALHTILLGIIKWLSRASLALVSKDALNWQRFSHPFRGKEIVINGGLLLGKDFRRIIQVGPFMYDGLLPQPWIKAWCCMADVFLLVYMRQIPNLEAYIFDLQRAITASFASICDINPKIFSRLKYHALVHLGQDVRQPSVE